MSTLSPYRYNAKTHVGLRRKVNEDAVLALPGQDIWVVSDGMGGHEAGDFASRVITDSIAMIPAELSPTERMHALRDAMQTAHRIISEETEARGAGLIGATVAALMMTQGYFLGLWAGDSRIYLLRDGHIEMLTTDHSYVADLVLSGKMTWDEAEMHPHSNAITRAVGVDDELVLDKIRGETQRGDRFLVCSDGLTKYATFGILQDMLTRLPIETVSDELVQLALNGGGADNISVIVVDVL